MHIRFPDAASTWACRDRSLLTTRVRATGRGALDTTAAGLDVATLKVADLLEYSMVAICPAGAWMHRGGG
jgi:hypothetical protein